MEAINLKIICKLILFYDTRILFKDTIKVYNITSNLSHA